MTSRAWLGVDVGTSGARVVLVDEHGTVVRSASGEYPIATPRPGWTEQDPRDWWRVVRKCLDQIAAPAGTPIGLTGQMHGAVFLDERDQVVRPALLWNDQRTVEECRLIEREVGPDAVRAITGNPPLPGFQLPKWLWLRAHEPANAARVRSLLLPKDYIRLRLTSERVTDVSDASGTGAFDVARRTWSEELLRALDVDPALFPPVRESASVAGAGDQAAAAVGSGAVYEGILSVSLGTSGVVFAALNEMPERRDDAVHLFCHATGRWHAMTVMLSAGGAVRWLRDTMYQEAAGSYETIMRDAASVGLLPDGPMFLPYLAGERAPHNDPAARGAFVGLGLHHSRAHLARAVIEGVTFGLLDGLRALQQVTGSAFWEIRVTGGGARSPVWRQLIADVFGMPVVTLGCDEGSAFGAAILAGLQDGAWSSIDEACDHVVRLGKRTSPTDGASDGAYGEAYERYRALYPTLRPVSHGNA